MLRRILVGLDPSECSATAVRASCYYARLVDATVIGVGVVDREAIEHSEYGGAIGADHYAAKAVERRLKEAHDTIKGLVGAFERRCTEQEVRFESHIRTGEPAGEILDLAHGADIFVSGNRTFFQFATDKDPDDALARVLRGHVVPVLALPAGIELPFKKAVIAYDSSPSAARALRNYVYQSWDRPFHPEVTLLRVDEDHDAGERALAQPRLFLEAYGFEVKVMVEPGDVTSTIREVLAAESPSLLVLGSRGRWAPWEALFGGTTRELLDDGEFALLMAA